MTNTTTPLIWALTGRNRGDNAQALALAGAVAVKVGGVVREVPLRFNLWREAPWLGVSLQSLASPPPTGPWPDMVIGVGRRAVPVARWIRAQKPCRLVWIGRPRAALDLFDIVLTTPQYGVPAAPNVIRLSLPFATATPPARALTPLMIIGGDSWANRLTIRTVDRLAAAAIAAQGEMGGQAQLRITTSPRTPKQIADAVAVRFPAAEFHFFGSGQNPYQTWLSEASACIVTSDSVSLIADAVTTGAPTYVALADDARLIGRLKSAAPALADKWFADWGNRKLLAPPPNPEAVLAALQSSGFATRAPDYVTITKARTLVCADQQAAMEKVAVLLC